MSSQAGSFDNEIRQPHLRCFEKCRHGSLPTFELHNFPPHLNIFQNENVS